MHIWETGDVTPLADIATPDAVYDDVPNGERFEGLDGIRRYVGHVHSWAAQVDITISKVHSGPDFAIAEWRMRGVQDRPIPGRVPVATNRPFELKGATLIELRDGRIARAADYIDVLGFVVQLGGRVELPGGVVIPPDGSAAQEGDAADTAPPRGQ
jgi:ketosteroid isomerase-like protein